VTLNYASPFWKSEPPVTQLLPPKTISVGCSELFSIIFVKLAKQIFLGTPSARERLAGDGKPNFADKRKAHLGIVVEQLERSFFLRTPGRRFGFVLPSLFAEFPLIRAT
jgi:hypothetical protein